MFAIGLSPNACMLAYSLVTDGRIPSQPQPAESRPPRLGTTVVRSTFRCAMGQGDVPANDGLMVL